MGMGNMNKTILAGILGIAGLLVAAPVLGAWAQEDPADDTTISGTVQIGGLFPLTGDLASVGTQLKVAAELAVDDYNEYLAAQGAGWQIELVSEDTGANPVQALDKLQSLAARGITISVGPATSGATSHVKGYADLNDMLLVSCCSTSPALAISGDSVYRFVPDDSNQGAAIATMAYMDGITGLVPMWRGDTYGDGLRDAAQETFEKFGGEVHSGVRYSPDETKTFGLEIDLLNKYVKAMVEKHGADKVAVFIVSFDEGQLIMQHANDYSTLQNIKWYGGEALAQQSYLTDGGVPSQFAQAVDFEAVQILDSPGEKTNDVRDRVTEIVGEVPISFVHPSYDSIWVIGNSIMEANSADAADVKEVFSDVAAAYSGALPTTKLNAAGDLNLANYQLWNIVDSDWTKNGIFAAEKGILAAPEQPTGEVQVGSLYPLTGRQDSTGYDTRDATQLGADHFNEFLNTINAGWTMKIVSEDSATNAQIALEKVTTFNAKGIDIIIGPRISSTVEHVKPYADINKMMIISCCSTAPRLAIADDNVFRMAPDDTKQSVALAKLLENEGIEVVVPIWLGDTYGDGLRDATKADFEAKGYTFAEGVRYNPDLVEFGVSVDALNEAVADAIDEHGADRVAVFLIAFDEAISIIQGAATPGRDALQEVRWFTAETLTKKTNILDDPIASDFIASAQLTGVQVAESGNDIHDMVETYFVEKNGETPITFVYHSYDAAWLVGLSMLQSGATDAPTIMDTFPDVASRYMGAIGDATLNDAGDLAAADYAVWSVIDNEWVQIGKYTAADDSILITVP